MRTKKSGIWTKKCAVLPTVHVKAKNWLPERSLLVFFLTGVPLGLNFIDVYCVVTIQSGAIAWINGEFVISPNVPSELLIPNAEMLEDPKLAT
jgi:hypothetical protein